MDAETPRLNEQLLQSSGSYELVLSAVLLGLFGLYLDSRLGSTPWLAVAFTVAGFAGSTASIYYRYRHRISELQAETTALRAEADTRRTEASA